MRVSDSTIMTPQQLEEFARLALEQVKRVNQKIPVLGPVTWLMMQQSGTRHALLSDLEWRIMPPLVLDQAKLYLRDETPMAFVTWAKLSDEVVKRYCTAPHHLSASDWRSGDQAWIIDLVTPYGGAQDILKDVREHIFPGQPVFQLAPMIQGRAKILEWETIGQC